MRAILVREIIAFLNMFSTGNYLVVQWFELCTFTAEGKGSVIGWGIKIP